MFAPMPAYAQSSEAEVAGRTLFNEGMAFFAQGNYAQACPKFEASLARLPGIGTRGKLAECYEKLGRTASAWSLYREVAVFAARAGQSAREQLALNRANALEPRLARILITDSNVVPAIVVRRNGIVVPREELGAAVAADPGDVLVEASAPGCKPWSTKARVAESGVVRVDVPLLERAAPSRASAFPNASDPLQQEIASSALQDPAAHRSPFGTQRTVGLAVGGAGLASLLAGTYFGLSAKSTYDDAFDADCQSSDKTCNAAGQEKTESARSKAVASTILFGAAAALITTGTVLFFTAPKRESRAASVRVAPSVGVGSAGLIVSGRL
ncbi:tol-pal system YbgF family protein [Pendulispora albinea]|uniref:Tetratricopeptide repeat protein n=1 Tax=Pendulispora albinea TaxID=2741071 RepID=A0ABZ2LML1_9BACT